MIKFISKIIILSFFTIIILTSCHSKTVGHRIVGIWEHAGNRVEFTTSGYMKKGDIKYPYTVTDKNVTIDDNGEALVVEYTINPNGTMTMNGIIYYPVKKGK